MSIPKISVVMPTYNDQSTIIDAVESVINQSFSQWELLIINDASAYNVRDFISRQISDDRVRVFDMPRNIGSGACRNYAIGVARGDFIAILDADDECLPTRFEKQLAEFQRDPGVDVVASQVLEFGEWGGPIVGSWPTDPLALRARQLAEKMPVPHPSVMFRKRVVEHAGGYDEACRRAQDFALFLKLKDSNMFCISEPLVLYRTSRPVSFNYALKNQMYVDLAKLRHRLWVGGVHENELPTEPKVGMSVYIKAIKGWSVRTVREFVDYHSTIFRISRRQPYNG